MSREEPTWGLEATRFADTAVESPKADRYDIAYVTLIRSLAPPTTGSEGTQEAGRAAPEATERPGGTKRSSSTPSSGSTMSHQSLNWAVATGTWSHWFNIRRM